MDFLTRFFFTTRRILFCCRDSREMLRGRSSESTTFAEGQPLRHQVLAVVHNEHTAHVQLDVVELLLTLALEHDERSALGHEQTRTELELALDAEVLHCHVLLPVIGKGLVEGSIL